MRNMTERPPEIHISRLARGADLDDCFMIRRKVFIEEQEVSEEEEMDGLDDQAEQYLLTVDGKPAATARVRYPDNSKGKVERVAVLQEYRGLHLGEKLMNRIIDDISGRKGIGEILLAAQTQVIGFYEKLGFEAYGEEFLDANIPHYWMNRPASEK